MNKLILYGPLVIILGIGFWYSYQGEKIPDDLQPLLAFLLALMSVGYGNKAKKDGDIGAGNARVRRDKNPRIFQIALFLIYLVAGIFAIWSVYLLVYS